MNTDGSSMRVRRQRKLNVNHEGKERQEVISPATLKRSGPWNRLFPTQKGGGQDEKENDLSMPAGSAAFSQL
jgi:hypothetical protein